MGEVWRSGEDQYQYLEYLNHFENHIQLAMGSLVLDI